MPRFVRVSLRSLLLATSTLFAAPIQAQPTYFATAPDTLASFPAGASVASATFPVTLAEDPANPTFPTLVAGAFTLAFQIDPAVLEVTAVDPTGPLALICGSSWDLFDVDLTVAGCPGTVRAQAVFGFACDVFFPYEVETPLIEVTVETLPGVLGGSSLATMISGETCPTVAATVPSFGGPSEPIWIDALVTFEPDDTLVDFVRGDCNQDGAVQIADAISLLGGLFGGVPLGDCLAACEMHDDDASPDIADAVFLLQHLFTAGPPPAEPYPDCGVGASPTPGECVLGPACP